ncbi:hypothetical protein B6V74_00215 [Thioclava sp. F42-5]|uniref:response regulator n=1 Tax=Thioclava sp. F42-5 TaxID=1973005 RepID=UPI000B5400E7|nr:response regulator [Thioclava sp. F42-5]OWY10496.1 hypothetical protein B6V74_00215 [Thioclava sp. F42-5]
MRNDGTRVLLVEDEAIIRMDFVVGLENLGFDVIEANAAATALGLLDAGLVIDVLVTDIDMPGDMNGLALAREVRRRCASCRIIVMSGHSTPESDEMPERSVFLPKPLSPHDLAAAFT